MYFHYNLNPVKNINTRSFLKTKKIQNVFILTTLDMFIHFLNKLQKADKVLEQPIVVSSVIDELRSKQHCCKTSEKIKLNDLISYVTSYWETWLKWILSNLQFFLL